ncbi:MAG TPA: hypothetical protein VN622_07460 [Clostridia bacterium]|nr:hypothetical protein [Clostridia bacterium]
MKLWPLAVTAFAAVILMVSIGTSSSLRTQVPDEFLQVSTSRDKTPDAELARAYWETAVRAVQWKYHRGSELPQEPPAEFQLPPGERHRTSGQEQVARGVYWQKLRELWLKPDIWRTSYHLDLTWTVRAVQDVTRGISQFFRNAG